MTRSPNSLSLLLSVVFVSVTLAASGCSAFRGVNEYIQYNDETNDCMIGLRNGIGAHLVWYDYHGEFSDEPHLSTFGAGFRAGYKNIASGGNGCPPPVPPRKYWSWKYQTEKGQAKVSAWFAGFPYGVMVAEQKGLGEFGDIQVSYPIKTQYSPEFRAGGVKEVQRVLLPQTEDNEYETSEMPSPVMHQVAQHSSLGSKSQSVEVQPLVFMPPIKGDAPDGDEVKNQKR